MNGLLRILSFINSHPLARKNRSLAFYRLLHWQIGSVFNRQLRIAPFIGPLCFWAKKGMTGITGNIYTGLHEFEDMAFVLHFLRREDLFADIGANAGSYTLLASGICGCRSVAFEPSPETAAVLQANIVLNRIENLVTLENSGVGAEEKQVTFTTGLDTTNHVIHTGEEAEGIKINICSLDHYLQKQVPALIKIDTEGFESEVIAGAQSTLGQPELQAIIIELNGSGRRYGYDDLQLHRQLIALGFRPYHYEPFSRQLKELESFGNHNTLYLRNLSQVKQRLKEAPPFKALNIDV